MAIAREHTPGYNRGMPKKKPSQTQAWQKEKMKRPPEEIKQKINGGPRFVQSQKYSWPGDTEIRRWFINRDWTVQKQVPQQLAKISTICASIELHWRVYYVYLKSNGRLMIQPGELKFVPWWHWKAGLDDMRKGLPDIVVETLDALYDIMHDPRD